MTVSPGDLWVAAIPFTDGSATKRRPALVLWVDGPDVVVAAVTSAQPRSATDIALLDWQTSGLRVPSTVRLSRLDCLEKSLLVVRLGRISTGDAASVKMAWSKEVRLSF